MDTFQFEDLRELQIGLKDFKTKTLNLMDTTSMLLDKKYTKQPWVNLTSAEQVKELLNKEQTAIEQQFNAIKADIYEIISQSVQMRDAQVTTTPIPGASATISTPLTFTEDTKLPYFVARIELSKKC